MGGGQGGGAITVTFFDKMSFRRARVKIKSGMVTLLIPCVYAEEYEKKTTTLMKV